MSVRANTRLRHYLVTTALVAIATGAQAQSAPPSSSTPAADSTTVKEVVVTGQRAAITNAINTKRSADVILDAVSADDAGKLPDNSVTEVLQRLPGVNITRIQTGSNVGAENYLAEGTDLTIRGFDSVSQINNRDSFSSVNGRNLAWEDIPPELMRQAEIYKTEAGYLPEGAFGGVVNLDTNKPFDFKGFTVNGSIGGNYADYAGKAGPQASLLVSNRWQTPVGEIGVLLDVAYSDLQTKADGVQVQPYEQQIYLGQAPNSPMTGQDGLSLPYLSTTNAKGVSNGPGTSGAVPVYVPYGVDFSEREDDRVRTGYYAALQWRPNDQLQLGLTVFDSQYQLNSLQHLLMVDDSNNTEIPVGAAATFSKSGMMTYTSALQGYNYAQPGSAAAASCGSSGSWCYTSNGYDFQTTRQQTYNQTLDTTIDGEWKPNDRLDVKFAFQHVDSSAQEVDHYAYLYAFLPPVSLTLSPYGSSALPKLGIPSSVNLADPSNYGFLATMDHMMDNQGTENAFYADGKYKFDNKFLPDVRFGVKVTDRNENDWQTPYNYQALSPYYGTGPNYNYLTTESSYLKYGQLVNTGSWFNGQMGLPAQAYFPSLAMLNTSFASLHQTLGTGGNNVQGNVQYLPGDDSTIRETTQTVYLVADFRDTDFIVPFAGNIGLRLIHADDRASGSLILPSTLGSTLTPQAYNCPPPNGGSICSVNFAWPQTPVASSGGRNETSLLPSLNLQFNPRKDLKLRFSASEGLDRPSFAQMNPQATLGGTYVGTYTNNWISSLQGNPDLKPERALQLDASAEYYWGRSGIAQFAVFYKKISDYIGTTSGQAVFDVSKATITSQGAVPTASSPTGPAGNWLTSCAPGTGGTYTVGQTCGQQVPYTSQYYFNENAPATVQGFEVGLTKYADFLPAPLSGFGINANYTYIDSQQPGAMAYDMTGAKINDLPVTGLSKNTVNFALMYDNGPLSARLAYNWRDDFLITTTAYQTSGAYDNWSYVPDTTNSSSVNAWGKPTYYSLPVFSYPVGTLDGNLSYKISNRITWVLEASNLTKETERLYMGVGSERANRSWYTADRRYTTAVRFNF
jgi:iron complex outermembrane recepter protein